MGDHPILPTTLAAAAEQPYSGEEEFATSHPKTHAVAQSLQATSSDEAPAFTLISNLSRVEAAATPEDGITLLMLAAAAGASKCCELLIALGVPVSALDAFGCDALYYAVRHQKLRCVDALLVGGASVDAAQCAAGGSCLIEAAVLGDHEIAALLCAARAQPDAADPSGDTAVKAALRVSAWACLTILGAYGCTWGRDEMKHSEGGWHMARGAGALEAGRAAFLLGIAGVSASSIPNLIDEEGRTPLHVCATRGWHSGARTLLSSKANPHARDRAGRDACCVAAASGQNGVIRVLLANGANPKHAPPRTGRTAFMEAAVAGTVKGVALLWAAHADPDATDSNGLTALELAAREDPAGKNVRAMTLLFGVLFGANSLRPVKQSELTRCNKQSATVLRALKERGRADDRQTLVAALTVFELTTRLCATGLGGVGGGMDLREAFGEPSQDVVDGEALGLCEWGARLRHTRYLKEEEKRRREKRLIKLRAKRRQSAAGRIERVHFDFRRATTSPSADAAGVAAAGGEEEEGQAAAAGADGSGRGPPLPTTSPPSSPTSMLHDVMQRARRGSLSLLGAPGADATSARGGGGGSGGGSRGARSNSSAGGEDPRTDSNSHSPSSSGRASPVLTRLLADMDEMSEISESPSEIAARYAAGPDLPHYAWASDKDFVRKERVQRWADSNLGIGGNPTDTDERAADHDDGVPAADDVAMIDVTDAADGSGLAPLLLSTRLPTPPELEQLLYETSERARDEHAELVPPPYVYVAPGGGVTSLKPAVKGGAEFANTGGLVEEVGVMLEGYSAVAIADDDLVVAGSAPPPHARERASDTNGKAKKNGKAPTLMATYPYAVTPEKLKAINKRAKGFGKESA